MTDIERDIDYILSKTNKLFTLIEQEKYHLIESKEVVRKQLIDQFFIDYSPEEIVNVSEKFELLVKLTTTITQTCEALFQQTKDNIVKIKKSDDIIKAYK
jgi:hypothetical protein